MQLSAKGRYAVTAMVDLALHDGQGSIPLAEISTRQKISLFYLEQIFARLRKCGLVESARGPGGGYRLGRKADDIPIFDIIQAVEEATDVRRCAGQRDCRAGERCLTHDLWAELSRRIESYLHDVDLGALADQEIGRRATRSARAQPATLAGSPRRPAKGTRPSPSPAASTMVKSL